MTDLTCFNEMWQVKTCLSIPKNFSRPFTFQWRTQLDLQTRSIVYLNYYLTIKLLIHINYIHNCSFADRGRKQYFQWWNFTAPIFEVDSLVYWYYMHISLRKLVRLCGSTSGRTIIYACVISFTGEPKQKSISVLKFNLPLSLKKQRKDRLLWQAIELYFISRYLVFS